MRTAVFAASHMLAALGVAVLALSSPTDLILTLGLQYAW